MIKGRADCKNELLVGKITYDKYKVLDRSDRILVTEQKSLLTYGYKAIIPIDSIYQGGRSFKVSEGDIVGIFPNGEIQIFHDVEDSDHTIFLTNLCNSRCIMCPQPPEKESNETQRVALEILQIIEPRTLKQIGITGGEPTLHPNILIEILNFSRLKQPQASVQLLTNGRTFQNYEFTKKICITNPRIIFGIPLYAPTNEIHDSIVGAEGAFSETIKGLHNLYRLHQHIELRIVLIKNTIFNLELLASFVFRNLSFVSHVAFMGAEYVGNADENLEDVWIEPEEYREILSESIWYLHQRGMNVSIYNLPLCLLPVKLHQFARDSISPWKKTYLPICCECNSKERCSGIFATSTKQSEFIRPFKNILVEEGSVS